jgi:hypothetical protein
MFFVAASCLIADLVLSARLSWRYYTLGLVLMKVRRVAPPGPHDPPSGFALDQALRSGGTVLSDFGGFLFGFRRSLLFGSGLLLCTIEFDRSSRSVTARGRLGIFFMAFLVAGFIAAPIPFDSLPFFALGLAALGTPDYFLCRSVVLKAVRLWSHPHSAAA